MGKTARSRSMLAIAAVLTIMLTGCGTGGSPETDDSAGKESSSLYERSVTLTDGRTVTCVVYAQGYKGGLSCDWEGASRG